MTTIVVGYVAKPEGRAALRRAAEEAKLRGARLVVINSERGGRNFDADDARQHEAELETVRTQLADAGIEAEVRQLVRGMDVAEDLIAVAQETVADFIVIGLRRRSPVGKLILGSNAQRILLDAPCPVLAVKAEDGDIDGEEPADVEGSR
ncbi:universal stress protein [Phytoactinopolyspora mesophila]|uniref:Universal stress protein n=1 Tax=Phytoactinopolyspora mesophila TaxID=2650750 RepID=A0A7K3LZA4_9ACTN|nr:universal stress protein [Phytoactinopolyspora mesophila]NDL56329.1 universal stress protein [Phytoactinopolyspora mesophila]